MITEKLYLTDMYAREAVATVLEIKDNQVILDKTVFFAEGGGQLGDKGLIGPLKVDNTQKKITKETKMLTHPEFPSININMNVAHVIEGNTKDIGPGDMVKISIDWERRYSIMRLHSAAHIVWHFVEKLLDSPPIKGCLIGPEKSRLDFGAKIDPDAIPEITQMSNEFISNNYPIQNKALDNEPEALWWICNQIKIPCGGTHVRNTGEIGSINIKRRSQGKKLDRLYISLNESKN